MSLFHCIKWSISTLGVKRDLEVIPQRTFRDFYFSKSYWFSTYSTSWSRFTAIRAPVREMVSLASMKEKMQVIKGAGKHISIPSAFSACVLDTRRLKRSKLLYMQQIGWILKSSRLETGASFKMLHTVQFHFCDILRKKGLWWWRADQWLPGGRGEGVCVYTGAAGGVWGWWNCSVSWLWYLYMCQNSWNCVGEKTKTSQIYHRIIFK